MIKYDAVSRAFDHVRGELWEAGLLRDGAYLDEIDIFWARSFKWWVNGWVYLEPTGGLMQLVGLREGAIYVNGFSSVTRAPGHTLRDVVRHEFGHAWVALDPMRFDEPWFERAFGAPIEAVRPGARRLYRRYRKDPDAFRHSKYRDGFVSPYALVSLHEDFAETFMTWLRNPGDLERFANRKGLYRKLKAVDRAARKAARELGTA